MLFLAYADTQPAVLLLFMLECLDPMPRAPESPVICTLRQRLEARSNNQNHPASRQKEIFEALTSLLLPEVFATVPKMCLHVRVACSICSVAHLHVSLFLQFAAYSLREHIYAQAESVLDWIFKHPQMPTARHLYNFCKADRFFCPLHTFPTYVKHEMQA